MGSWAKCHCTGTQWLSCRRSRCPLGLPGGGAQFEVINVYEYNGSVRSLLYANGVAASLSDHLLRSNPRGSQLFLSHRWVVKQTHDPTENLRFTALTLYKRLRRVAVWCNECRTWSYATSKVSLTQTANGWGATSFSRLERNSSLVFPGEVNTPLPS